MKISPDKLRLYAVTDRTWLGKESLEEAVEAALRGGVTILQLREKQAPHEELVKTAMRLKPLCRRYGVPLIINDDVEAALEADADGVHVGQEDMAVAEARRILGPEKIIGASAHNREEALEAQRQGADYLGSGAVFGSSTKKRRHNPVPGRADGGLSGGFHSGGGHRRHHGGKTVWSWRARGVSGIAVVSALFAAADKEEAAARLRALAEKIAERS